ncbi:PepSY domain-containing protein [Burkholderia sp. RS01]|uniref:PepSY domain-containing protein n=1 Tax=unclassified Burkholderia TaxID=2613784 RepID=UPI003218208B
MRKRTAWIIGAAVAAAALGGATVAAAAGSLVVDDLTSNGGSQSTLSQADRDKAVEAALAKVGPGTVTDVEDGGDPGSAYEVEIRLNSGPEVEVNLGPDFQVLNQGAEDD